MKLRTKGSSVRLRLTRGEVARIAAGERIEEVVEFAPGERLVYALECGGDAVTARFVAARLTVTLPSARATAWAASEEVGIEAHQPIGGGKSLHVLVEKDFACLTKREGEDDVDAFPNPNERC